MIAEINHKFIAQAKMLKLFKLIRILCNNRYTIKEMAEQLDTSSRTIERYIGLLEFMDVAVEKGFDKKYFIVQGCCPLCGITTNNTLQ
jgi:predicted DNA-binding transcriptional regulator YafY